MNPRSARSACSSLPPAARPAQERCGSGSAADPRAIWRGPQPPFRRGPRSSSLTAEARERSTSWHGTIRSAMPPLSPVLLKFLAQESETMFGYRVPAPDEAMLISGGRRGMNDAPFRVVTGHGAFVTPFVRKVRYLTLSMQEAEGGETCGTHTG